MLPGDQVGDPAGDRDGVVGEALVVAPAQRHVDRRLDAVLPLVVEQHGEQLAVQAVHDVVVELELSRDGEVAAGDHAARLGDDPLGHLAHLQDRRAQLGGDGRLGVAHPRELRHVPGEVAHPLQVGAHAQAGDDHAQIRRDRGLPGEQRQGALLDVPLEPVDLLVGADHALGQGEVRVEQGRRRPADGRPDQPGHLDHLVGEGVELLVELLPHRRSAPLVVRRLRSPASRPNRPRVP